MNLLLMSVFAALLLTGCYGEAAMRTTAATSAAMVNDYRNGLQNYVDSQSSVLSSTESRINAIAKDQRWVETNVETQIRAWKAVNNAAALNLYMVLTNVTAESILIGSPELRTLRPTPKSAGIKIDTKQFDAVIKSLTTLAQNPGFNDRVQFFSKYGSAVSKAYKDSLDNAAKEAVSNSKQQSSPKDQSE